jgi:hypothetical protein
MRVLVLDHAFAQVSSSLIPAVSFLRSLASARKSHSTWMPCQKVSDWPMKDSDAQRISSR